MRRCHLLATLIACAAALAAAPAANAAFFPAESIDGPNADIVRVGDVDVAREGDGGLVYLKRVGGVQHVFVARMTNGAWGGGEQVDTGQAGPSSDPHVAVADGGRVVATWINGGRLWAALRESTGAAWGPPTLVYQGATVDASDLEMSLHDVAYAAWSAGGDVLTARLKGTQWNVISPPVDNDPSRPAGGGSGPDVVAAADGTGLVTWEEVGGDGRTRVYARRVIRTQISSQVREVSVPNLEGHAGGDAANPDAGVDDDSSFGWVVLQQVFDDGGVQRRRVYTRRLVGSDYDPPVPIDSLGFPGAENAEGPHIDQEGRERALATATLTGGATLGAIHQGDAFASFGRIDTPSSAGPPVPVPAQSPNGTGAFAWFEDPGGGGTISVLGRFFDTDDVLETEVPISNGGFGGAVPSLGIDASADRASDVAIAFVQGGLTDRRVVVAHYDRPLREVALTSAFTKWQKARPRLAWGEATEFWGTPQYRLDVDGFPFAVTTATSMVPPNPLPDGSHNVRITTVDRRGQATPGPTRKLKIDGRPPSGKIRARGSLRRGRVIRFIASAKDKPPTPPPGTRAVPTSGIAKISVSFGDRTRAATRLKGLRHVYRRAGRFKIRFVITDGAGNRKVIKLTVRIR